MGLISWWPRCYSALLTTLDPTWKQVLAQFANAGVYSPNLLHLPILLGLAFLLAVYTVIRDNPLKLARYKDNDLFLLAWFLVSFLLIYLPVDYQIHMLKWLAGPHCFAGDGRVVQIRSAVCKEELGTSCSSRRSLATWLSGGFHSGDHANQSLSVGMAFH